MKEFAEVARRALEECEAIPCSILEFVLGLDQVIDHLVDARRVAEECRRAMGGEE